MNKFWELVKSSVLVQASVTLALVITLCVLWATAKPVPPDLIQLTLVVVGFWFGSKAGYTQGVNSTK